MSFIDITGQRFGKLTVIEKAPNKPGVKGQQWRCLCDCGKETIGRGPDLRKGDKKSCGCLQKKAYDKIKPCEYCGNPVSRDDARFCSRSCAGLARYYPDGNKMIHRIEVDESYDLKKVNGRYKCRYQRFVSCTDRDCANCGWNPEVAKARTKAIMEQRGVATV